MSQEQTLSDLDTLITIQYSLLDLVGKELINFKKDGAKIKNRAYYFRRLQNLQNYHLEFHQNHRRILGFEKISNHEYCTTDTPNTFQEEHLTAFATIQEAYDVAFPAPDPNVVANTNNQGLPLNNGLDAHFDVHLPKLNINTFTGNYSEWPSFYDSFKVSTFKCKIVAVKEVSVSKGIFV